ncbi:primary-amine oxidase [Natrarchaeobius oligotrophus]|uniref:Amine oxidase n=1 Tax=Natrarchaeobius chitinivorans TaxID=1679083 RepID=A0A3N6PM27_NATCH|nr:primary-amine oxidase [Natrarchaeobius chitinivorans]RQH02600.1 primary-amine oxidase [Natrarchaeobius chitinivorans]
MASTTYPVDHPLDPLAPSEIEAVREILEGRTEFSERTRYVEIALDEPPKAELRRYETDGDDPDRRARVVVRDKENRATYEGIVSLTDDAVVSWQYLPDAQPRMIGEEFDQVEAVVKNHDEFRAAVEKRGADPDLTIVSGWSAGADFVPDGIDSSRRLVHGIAWAKADESERGANGYNRPLSGIHVWVDMDDMVVLEVVDTGVTNPNVVDNMDTYHYRAENRELRDDLKPYNVVQPEGPSWEVDGREIRWQKWRMRVGFNHREGLVLHDIGYEDEDGTIRSIIDRASFPEVATPYTDPDPDHYWRMPFDVGEFGLGRLANSLTEGCDCLGYMHYFDGIVNDPDGEPAVIENAICLHEEDHGLLWKHHDWREGDDEVRRNRRLVVSFIPTIGNYDFGFYWYFYQDGSVEAEVRLTGCNATGVMPPGETESGFAEMIGPDHKSMLHQHVFTCRLDFAVDGNENSVRQVDLETVPYGPEGYDADPHQEPDRQRPNRYGNAAYANRQTYETESAAGANTNSQTGRYWEIVNENVRNAKTDQPVGYRLRQKSGDNTVFAPQPGSSAAKRLGLAEKHLWVTQHDDDEILPAGDYPNQNPGGEGLPAWVEQDRDVRNEDVVVWYNMIGTHVCAPEDWPILPAKMLSFKLEPVHFFEENPAIDVPPEHAIKDVEKWKTENQRSMLHEDDCSSHDDDCSSH